jgi:CO/xanthine dehydrogenase FAD-binding subunit
MLVEIELPARAARNGFCFMEVARRRGDYALMGIAASVTLGEDGYCDGARVALCGAGETPIDVSEVATALIGQPADRADFAETAAAVQTTIDPPGSIHASKEFQRHLAGVLVKRAVRTALERAQDG